LQPDWSGTQRSSLPLPLRSPASTSNALYTSQRASSANSGTPASLSTADLRPVLADTTLHSLGGSAGERTGRFQDRAERHRSVRWTGPRPAL